MERFLLAVFLCISSSSLAFSADGKYNSLSFFFFLGDFYDNE